MQRDEQNLKVKATLQKKQPKWDTLGLIQFPDLSVKYGFELPSGQDQKNKLHTSHHWGKIGISSSVFKKG